MKFKASLLISLLMLFLQILPAMAQEWQLEYGTKQGQVAVYNSNTDEKFAEDQPYGPLSMRVFRKQLWVLDSIGGKLHCFDQQKKLIKTVQFTGLPKNLLLEDFALITGSGGEVESVWVVEAAEANIRKISLASGKELLKIGGFGDEPGKFKQVNQIEVDRTGRLYVGDIAQTKISVFTPYGELVREIPWQRSGFALDGNSRLYLLRFSENVGYFVDAYTVKGQLAKSLHLGLAQLTNPRVWAVNPKGNIIVSFIPAGGFKGKLKLYEITPFGKILKRIEFAPPGSMNRYLAGSATHVWLAEADYQNAPQGKFVVKEIKWSPVK